VSEDNISYVSSISSRIRPREQEIAERCQGYSKKLKLDPVDGSKFACSGSISTPDVEAMGEKIGAKIDLLADRAKYNQLLNINGFISKKISEFILQLPKDRSKLKRTINLSNVRILWYSFDEADFTGIDISGATFDTLSMNKSKFTPEGVGPERLRTVNWWEAESINQRILIKLIVSSFPYNYEGAYYPNNYSIEYEDYARRIEALCTSKSPSCRRECLYFRSIKPKSGIKCIATDAITR
jgi:hypothetical protein